MDSIRKFVGYAGAAAAISAALAITMSTTGAASTRLGDRDNEDSAAATQVTVSKPCADAILTLKNAVIALIGEERAEALNPSQPSDPTEDATEFAAIAKYALAARDACAPAQTAAPVTVPASKPAVVPNSSQNLQCAVAVQALKAAWMQGRPTTQAQWIQLATLAKAARNACGTIQG